MNNQNNEETVIIEERITKVNGDFHIKKYARGKLLGKGGFAKVYNFTNLETNKKLAGKIIPKVNLNRSRSRQKLMVEIRLHQTLRHPNIVKFEHVFEDQENVYILLELCDNQSMNELFKRRRRLTEFEVQCYVIQVIDALKYLHSNRIIHRDLKLGNLFLSDKMQVKLGDFGLAAKLEFDGEKKRTVCGTPNYIAPEILDGNIGHSYEVDTWSLGVIIYTLIIGKPPFETTDIKLTYKKIKENDFSFPDHTNISENAKDVIKKILVTQPEKRLTLDEILQHPFINSGNPVPKLMPVSTLACPPTSSYVKQFASTSTSQRVRISTDPDTFDYNDLFKGSRCNTARLNTVMKSPNMSDAPAIDLFRMTPKTPQTEFFGSDRFNPLGIIGHDKARPSIFPTPKMANLKNYLNTEGIEELKEEDNYVVTKSIEQPKQAKQPKDEEKMIVDSQAITDLRVIKWYDYTVKYGLAYLLSNGSVGVFFNDGAKLIATSDETFDIIVRSSEKQEISKSFNFKDYPKEFHKKVLVYNRFKEHFEPTVKTMQKQDGYAYIKKWIRTKQAVFFRLSNRILQVIFKDESVLLMNSDAKTLTFITAKGDAYVCPLEQASSSSNKELTKRLKYTEEVLRHIWNAQTDGVAIEKEAKEAKSSNKESGIDIHGIDLNKNIFENPIEAIQATQEAATS